MNYNKILFIFSVFLVFTACTDPVDLDIKEGVAQLAVDGYISDQSLSGKTVVPDTVHLTLTNGYLKGKAPAVNDALIVISDNEGKVDTLNFLQDGKYITDTSKIKGKVGNQYTLDIFYKGEVFEATDYLPRQAVFDSLKQVFREKPQFGRAPGYFIELYAKDAAGLGDFYRFKIYKNNQLYNRPSDLNIAADASFSPEAPLDNVRYIFPIREALNPNTTETDQATGGNLAPYVPSDLVRVEICSISRGTYYFYGELQRVITNDGLFATPSFNVKTNIINKDPKSKIKAVGWFQAYSINSKEVTIREK